jgi:hypothetical protein
MASLTTRETAAAGSSHGSGVEHSPSVDVFRRCHAYIALGDRRARARTVHHCNLARTVT